MCSCWIECVWGCMGGFEEIEAGVDRFTSINEIRRIKGESNQSASFSSLI